MEGHGEYAVQTNDPADKNTGFGNTYRNNTLGNVLLVAGATFNAVAAGAGNPV